MIHDNDSCSLLSTRQGELSAVLSDSPKEGLKLGWAAGPPGFKCCFLLCDLGERYHLSGPHLSSL